MKRGALAAVVGLLLLLPLAGSAVAGESGAEGVGPGREPVPAGFADTIRVPADAGSIQAAVDAAEPGGMVLIAPGIYREDVMVTTPYLTIRGQNRNRVVLDGGHGLATGIHVVEADGVAIENLTARNYRLNGFRWTRVYGYRGSYLTAYGNGGHGLFADASTWGQFDHSYASGSPDSGFSVGGCSPCHAVITQVLAEHNALGYSGTNAGGDLAIVNSEWRYNFSGIVPNTLDTGTLAPQRDAYIAGNHVHDNNSTTADSKGLSSPTWGTGILIAGGRDNLIVGNLVENQETYGIALVPNLDANLWVTSGNEVRDNSVRASGRADLALGAPAAGGDCFSDNIATTSAPPAVELLEGCGTIGALVGGGDLAPTLNLGTRLLEAPDGDFRSDWPEQPAPPDQPQMPNASIAPPHPAIPEEVVPLAYRVRAIADIAPVPDLTVGKEITVFGIPLATSWWSLLIALYGYALPGFLYAAWLTIALWDLIRQDDVAITRRARWMAVVVLVPFAGPILYFGFGHSPIPKQLRLLLVVGGGLAVLAIAALAALVGG